MNKKRDLLAVIILLLGKYVIPYMIAFSLKYILRKDISSFQGQILDLAIVIITFVVIYYIKIEFYVIYATFFQRVFLEIYGYYYQVL